MLASTWLVIMWCLEIRYIFSLRHPYNSTDKHFRSLWEWCPVVLVLRLDISILVKQQLHYRLMTLRGSPWEQCPALDILRLDIELTWIPEVQNMLQGVFMKIQNQLSKWLHLLETLPIWWLLIVIFIGHFSIFHQQRRQSNRKTIMVGSIDGEACRLS